MKLLFLGLITSALALSTTLAHASPPPINISAENISTSNLYTISQNTIIDGDMFDEMSYGMVNRELYEKTMWWTGLKGTITLDLGNDFIIQEVLMQVDYDDTYQMEYSLDNNKWSNLFAINASDEGANWGMSTMSSNSLNKEYVASMDFFAVQARYLRVSASGGDDNVYFISELQAFGTLAEQISIRQSAQIASPVPAPPSLMLFSIGIMVLAGLQYRRKKLTSNA